MLWRFKKINDMKKNLATRLVERTESIEYRAIKKNLMVAAQNKQKEYLLMHISPETIIMLQNDGIKVEKFQEFGYDKYRLSWWLKDEEKLANRIKWAVDFNEKFISVPQEELTQAEENACVIELRALGFHIQSAIA